MFFLKKWLDQFLHSASELDTKALLNKKYVVTVSYLLFAGVCLVTTACFLILELYSHSLLPSVAIVFSLVGAIVAARKSVKMARGLFPWLVFCYTLIVSLMLLGSDSEFHWLLIILAVFSVTAYTVYQMRQRLAVCTLALIGFAVVELFAPKTTVFVNDDGALLVSLMMFATVAIVVSVMTSIVVTRLRNLNAQLKNLSELDDLTRLNNRRKVLAEAVNVFADSIINNEKCCFAILDIDHFKQINDVHGHEVGDVVLYEFAKVMKASLHSSYWLGRYGGEEFIVVMPNTYLDDAKRDMERMRIQLNDSEIMIEGEQSIRVTVSIGVASIMPSTERYEEILARADKSLYEAKRNGRNQVVVDRS